ncbi:LytR family transcriptional attenuator [Anaerobacterium chartisolvens]|uniref:LytR family transcriptional attenuator n=1 Tax=Anaerobacterium chartisolvens TaxID=1297424 RepID=A0A369BAY9_9FIRM|nr:LCP family protein [Anaerobacterium chartisolvens]RCX16844.1 LytR family transcriptional attenuator [Anaerobacterium chartisolvens]
MSLTKFSLVTTTIIMTFLFAVGIIMIGYINTSSKSTSAEGDLTQSSGLGGIMSGMAKAREPVNVLVMGGDKVNGNTDTILLVNFDPNTTKTSILSIPRDTRVVYKGYHRKINFAYPSGGAEAAVDTVQNLLNVNVKYFVYIDTAVFRNIIDELGGIQDFYVPADMDYDDDTQGLHIHLKRGIQNLDGKKAEQFMRYRGYNRKVNAFYDGSDIKRIEAQQNLINELIRQKASILYIHKFNSVLEKIFDSLKTNMTLSEILSLAQNINSFKPENVSFFTLPGEAQYIDSISYYIHDRYETGNMMVESFNAEGVFDASKPVTGGSYYEGYTGTAKEPSEEKSYTKNNPSNSESSIKKSPKPKA